MGLQRSTAVTTAAAVAASATALHLAGPPAVAFISDAVPRVHSTLLGWLEPPFLYLLLNVIILSIAASSRLYSGAETSSPELSDVAGAVVSPPALSPLPAAEKEELIISRSDWSRAAGKAEAVSWAPSSPATSSSVEKPLASARFVRRRSPKSSVEGRALRVARPKREQTLESTWRAITEGKPVPLGRHLKKSDTWETHHKNAEDGTAPAMRKVETFRDSGRFRREPSVGQEELNRRVEAFIKKFNEEMRLQRQESFRQYLDMVSR